MLISATLLCSMVAGFLFAFAIVTMPGLKGLNDRDFIRAFQAIDGVIQNRQPIFIAVWVGSVVALLLSVALASGVLGGYGRLLIISATLIYMLGVQLPTLIINVPLNNRLQLLQVDAVDAATQQIARSAFEPRWNRWNAVRTTFAILTASQLIVVLFIF